MRRGRDHQPGPRLGRLAATGLRLVSQPLPSFGDQTAEALVKEGRSEAVKRYLDRIAVGGYA